MILDPDPMSGSGQPPRDGLDARHHVVVVGAGFGGLEAVKALKGAPVRITLIDQRNHHLFQPLLYQVATASLATSEIAWPIRAMVRDRRDVQTLLARVTGVDVDARRVDLEDGQSLTYDTLVLATGARHAYFGHDEWEPFAPGLKTLEDAISIRRRILLAFEQAEFEPDAATRATFLTFVVIGAGPTGVELAGTIAELARDTLPLDFRNIDTMTARVVLVEAAPRVLGGYRPQLSAYAQRALERIGVEVRLGRAVTCCDADGVILGDERIAARTLIWAAGVQASPAAQWVKAPADAAGRLKVLPDLTVPGRPEIFAIGDTVSLTNPDGSPVPGIAPAAKQQGEFVGRNLKARLSGLPLEEPFHYTDAGRLAQIGKRAAVADFGWIALRGALAWWLWGAAHIYFLVGVRSRMAVVLNWLWLHWRNQRAARLITQGPPAPEE
jgi:NADH dehydrogenase